MSFFWRERGETIGVVPALVLVVAADHIDDRAAQISKIDAELDEDLGAHSLALTDEAKEDVLGADVAVTELESLAQAELEDLTGMRGERDVPVRRRGALPDHLDHLIAGSLQFDALCGERFRCHAIALADEAKKQVLRADVIVLQGAGFLLCEHDDAPRTVSKPFEHIYPSDDLNFTGRQASSTLLRLLRNCSADRRNRACGTNDPSPGPRPSGRPTRQPQRRKTGAPSSDTPESKRARSIPQGPIGNSARINADACDGERG